MKRKMKLVNDSRAVSPVIGVMLMVVVTVVLAAAVSSSSQGILDGVEQAPSAVFSVEIVKDIDGNMGSGETTSYISIRHVSGDSIDTKDLSIVTINPKAHGDNGVMEVHPNVVNTNIDCSAGGNYIGTVPFWNRGATLDTQEDSFFGEYILEPGRSMVADEWSNYEKANWAPDVRDNWAYRSNATNDIVNPLNDPITGMQAMFADWDGIQSGDHVTVKIIHNPSQKVIFDSDVRVI